MTAGYHPTAHLPAGRVLDRETYDELIAAWAAVDFRVMTEGEIIAIVGAPLPVPTLKRDFHTGQHPGSGAGPRYTGY